ncbi:hypothetical protein, partial [uncultured Gammaproteobacteria bacterium]
CVRCGNIHRHTGGLENIKVRCWWSQSIHRHTGGLEILDLD